MTLETLTMEEWNDIQDECNDLVQAYLEDNILNISEISFFDNLFNDVYHFVRLNGLQEGWFSEDDEQEDTEEINELYETIKEYCIDHLECIKIPLRDISPFRVYEYHENEVKTKIEWLDQQPIQKQRSAEWHAKRRQLFSASNLWKLFGTPSQYNSLIYEKCKEAKVIEYEGDILTPNARNWGVKYEPISVLVYEHKYNTIVNNNYGCIPHAVLPIGASPDGINIKENHSKYGHMLEIKNIYNREMNGIPTKEYWIQMQIQMETCRLEYCDFVETRFKEYSKEDFHEDETNEYKGVMLFFIPKESGCGKSQFIYVPLFTSDANGWIENKVLEMESHILYNQTYWYLDEMFCTEIGRNDMWFTSSIPKIIEGWETVLKERVDGFEHRAPQPRKKKTNNIELIFPALENVVNIIKLDENGFTL